MRISDWSSDVCSSDLRLPDALGKAFIIRRLQPDIAEAKRINIFADGIETGGTQPHHLFVGKAGSQYHAPHRRIIPIIPFQIVRVPADKEIGRASCRGKSVSVRVDLGGRRIIKKKTKDRST